MRHRRVVCFVLLLLVAHLANARTLREPVRKTDVLVEILGRLKAEQVLQDTNYYPEYSFPPMVWHRQRGLFESKIHINFHGNIILRAMRNTLTIPDDNGFVTSNIAWIVADMTRYAQPNGTHLRTNVSDIITDDVMTQAILAIAAHHDSNFAKDEPIMNFWNMRKGEGTATPFFYASPPNLVIPLTDLLRAFNSIAWGLRKLHLAALSKIAQLAAFGTQLFINVFKVPADSDDTGCLLALRAKLSSASSTFPTAANLLATLLPDPSSAAPATLTHYAYRPFYTGPPQGPPHPPSPPSTAAPPLDTSLLDPRSYYILHPFLQLLNASIPPDPRPPSPLSDVRLVSTWLQNHSELQVSEPRGGSQMPFRINNVDFSVAANALLGIASTLLHPSSAPPNTPPTDPQPPPVDHPHTPTTRHLASTPHRTTPWSHLLYPALSGAEARPSGTETAATTETAGAAETTEIDTTSLDPATAALFTYTAKMLAWSVTSETVLRRPDLALLYYPSIHSYYWFLARLAHMLEAAAADAAAGHSQRPLPPAMALARAELTSVLRAEGTDQLLRLASTDAASGWTTWDEFLGQADGPLLPPEDRVFATALAVNSLLDIWTTEAPAGSPGTEDGRVRLEWVDPGAAALGTGRQGGRGAVTGAAGNTGAAGASAPGRAAAGSGGRQEAAAAHSGRPQGEQTSAIAAASEAGLQRLAAVQAAVAGAVRFLEGPAGGLPAEGAFFSASAKSSSSENLLAYPTNFFASLDTDAPLPCSAIGNVSRWGNLTRAVAGVRGVLTQAEFEAGNCLGGRVPEEDEGRNCQACAFPYWSSPALTHALRALALVKWRAMVEVA